MRDRDLPGDGAAAVVAAGAVVVVVDGGVGAGSLDGDGGSDGEERVHCGDEEDARRGEAQLSRMTSLTVLDIFLQLICARDPPARDLDALGPWRMPLASTIPVLRVLSGWCSPPQEA